MQHVRRLLKKLGPPVEKVIEAAGAAAATFGGDQPGFNHVLSEAKKAEREEREQGSSSQEGEGNG